MLDSYKIINIENLKKAYCNDDWYVLVYADNVIEADNLSFDIRAQLELNNILDEQEKVFTRKIKKL